MQAINIKLDVSKLDKERFYQNDYTKRDGTPVTEVNANLVLIEKKDPRLIKEGENNGKKWQLMETHFLVEKRDKNEEKNYVGIGTQFVDTGASPTTDGISPDDIPF